MKCLISGNTCLVGMLLYWVILCVILFECKGCNHGADEKDDRDISSHVTKELTDEVLASIRSAAIGQSEGLSVDEKEFILRSIPGIGRYRMGLTLWEYYWSWKLPTGRLAVARYMGDLKTIEKEKIFISVHD